MKKISGVETKLYLKSTLIREKIKTIIHVYIMVFSRKWRESCIPVGLQENPRDLNVVIPIREKQP